MIYGLDVLGLAMFPSIAIQNWPSGFACGVFDSTFGNVWPALNKLAATGKCPRIRVQGPWTNHTYSPAKNDKAIFAALAKCNQFKAKFPHIHIQFSPVCEHNIKGQTLVNLLNKCGDASRDVEIVNNPYQGDFSKRFMNETHWNKPVPENFGAYQFSYDGISTVDSDVEEDKQTHKDAQVIFFWHPSFNLKYRTETDPKEQPANVVKNDTSPPLKRICKPTAELIRSVAALGNDKGATDFPKGWIGKTHADRSSTPIEKRAYKPVYITGSPAEKYEFLKVGGVKSSPPEPFNDKKTKQLLGWRYYLPLYGYEIATRRIEMIGNGKVLGTVNPAFRDGKFRP